MKSKSSLNWISLFLIACISTILIVICLLTRDYINTVKARQDMNNEMLQDTMSVTVQPVSYYETPPEYNELQQQLRNIAMMAYEQGYTDALRMVDNCSYVYISIEDKGKYREYVRNAITSDMTTFYIKISSRYDE